MSSENHFNDKYLKRLRTVPKSKYSNEISKTEAYYIV